MHAPEVEAAVGLDDDGFFQAQGVVDLGPAVEPAPIPLEADFDELHQASVTTPIEANFSARRRTSFSGFTDLRSLSCLTNAPCRVSAIASMSWCAPPSGSGTIS